MRLKIVRGAVDSSTGRNFVDISSRGWKCPRHVEKGMYLLFGYLYSAFQEFLKLAFSLNSSVNFLNDTSQISRSEINISVDSYRVLYH